ncbi:MAG: RDD family protein [Firmicutes bacterium]|nr:RDD family protein [Bacillota bacterium]
MQKCLNDKYEYAGFFPRFFSYITDLLIINIISAFVRIPIWFIMIASTDSVFNSKVLFRYTIYDVLVYACFCIYFIVMEYFTGTTFGKKMMNLRVISTDEGEKASFFDIFYRETIGRFLSSILWVGYICIFLTKEKKSIHDMLSDTRVVYGGKVKPAKVPVSMNQRNNAVPINNNMQNGVGYQNNGMANLQGAPVMQNAANVQNMSAMPNNVNVQSRPVMTNTSNVQGIPVMTNTANVQNMSAMPDVANVHSMNNKMSENAYGNGNVAAERINENTQREDTGILSSGSTGYDAEIKNEQSYIQNNSAEKMEESIISGKDPFGNSAVQNYDPFASSNADNK